METLCVTAKVVNQCIKQRGINLPPMSCSPSVFVNKLARPPKYWNRANTRQEDRLLLSLGAYYRKIHNLSLDHIKPVTDGGSFHVSNIRLLPTSINHMIGPNGWTDKEVNEFLTCLTPEMRAKLGVPKGFYSAPLSEFFAPKPEPTMGKTGKTNFLVKAVRKLVTKLRQDGKR
jgi:hypothetical protein